MQTDTHTHTHACKHTHTHQVIIVEAIAARVGGLQAVLSGQQALEEVHKGCQSTELASEQLQAQTQINVREAHDAIRAILVTYLLPTYLVRCERPTTLSEPS